MNILLTSAGRRTYLVEYFKEALQMAGVEGQVHTANSQECPAFYAADQWVKTPLIYEPEYIPFLLDYCKHKQIGMVIPLFDIDVPVLAAHRNEFGAIGTILVTADEDIARICNDKWRMYCFLREQKVLGAEGFELPKTWIDEEKAAECVRRGETHYPLMVKPRWGMGSLSIYQADDEEELRLLVKKARREIKASYLKYESQENPDQCVLIQEKLRGQEYGLDVIHDLKGNQRTVVVKQKEAMRSGETDGAKTVDHERLRRLGQILGSLTRHKGNLDVDAFESDGVCYVLEMNARFGGGYPFSHAAGVNLPYALVKWALGQEPEEKYLTARAGVRAQKDIRIMIYKEESK